MLAFTIFERTLERRQWKTKELNTKNPTCPFSTTAIKEEKINNDELSCE